MTKYEKLLIEADKLGIKVKEIDFGTYDECGYYNNKKILINRNITDKQKYSILAEELGHYYRTIGDITDQDKIENRKQELKARRKGYEILIEPLDLINAFIKGANDIYEMAEILHITPAILNDIIEDFRKQYGVGKRFGNYYVQFEPTFGFYRIFDNFSY